MRDLQLEHLVRWEEMLRPDIQAYQTMPEASLAGGDFISLVFVADQQTCLQSTTKRNIFLYRLDSIL